MLEALPKELLWIILTYFINPENELDPQNGTFLLDEHDQRVANERYDANAREGLAIAWKLVCKNFHEILPWNVECPLIELCDTKEMLDFVRGDWNPEHTVRGDTRLLDKAVTNANPKLKALMAEALPTWRSHKVFSSLAVSMALDTLLVFMHEQPSVELNYETLINRAIQTDHFDVVKWLIARRGEIRDMPAPDLIKYLFRAIKRGTPQAVAAVHQAKGGFICDDDDEEEDEPTLYERLDRTQVREDDCMLFRYLKEKKALKLTQELVDNPGMWSLPYEREEKQPRKDCTYEEAIPLAAACGKLEIVKLLSESLGYEMNSCVMEKALIHGHMDVAEYADRFPCSRCSVLHMVHTFADAFLADNLAARDPDYRDHYEMSAYQHLKHYTPESLAARRAQALERAISLTHGHIEEHVNVGDHWVPKSEAAERAVRLDAEQDAKQAAQLAQLEAKRQKEEDARFALSRRNIARMKERKRLREEEEARRAGRRAV